jgi:CheY-like chemotaxis protein
MTTIMVVDDNSDVRAVSSKGLRATGHEVRECTSGLDCLKKVEDGVLPEIIFLDVMMPFMDGWEVCRKIKTDDNFRGIIIYMLILKNSPDDISKSLEEVGAEWHLTKHISISKLKDNVDFLLTLKDSMFFNTFKGDFHSKNL